MNYTKVKFSNKLKWHYYFWIGGTKYLHGRMFSKEQAENLKLIQSKESNLKHN